MMDQSIEIKYRYAFSQRRPQHEPYDDFSVRHPKMNLSQRAKIFSPFDALKGFGQAIEEKLEVYVEKRELTEEEQRQIDQTLSVLHALTANRRQARKNGVCAAAVFFIPCADRNHEAYGRRGSYETRTGTVWKVDELKKTLLLGEDTIEFSELAALQIVESDEE